MAEFRLLHEKQEDEEMERVEKMDKKPLHLFICAPETFHGRNRSDGGNDVRRYPKDGDEPKSTIPRKNKMAFLPQETDSQYQENTKEKQKPALLPDFIRFKTPWI